MKQFTVKGHNWVSLNCDFNLYLIITSLIHKFKTTGSSHGHLSLSSFRYWFDIDFQEFLVKSKLCPRSDSFEPWGSCTPSKKRGQNVLYISCLSKLRSLCVLFHDGRLKVNIYIYIYIYILYIYTYIYYIYIIYIHIIHIYIYTYI